MASSRLISSYLRRTSVSYLRPLSLINPTSPPSTTTSSFTPTLFFFSPSTTTSSRYFSSQPSDSGFTHGLNSVTELELRSLGFLDGSEVHGGGLVEDSILPIRALVALLDGFHDLSGFPWWIVIASSTVALRITLLPVVLLQLQKLKKIGETFPKLPPPLPPPFSRTSFVDQFSLFQKERRAVGCPSLLWFLASFSIQVPCFFLWVTTIRRMSLDQYPGFDTGGIFWFQDLTEVPDGVLGPIFPLVVAGLHFCNVQIAFRTSLVREETGLLHLLAKWYKKYLDLLTLPLLFVGFYIPQGSLVYWVTNSSFTLIQQLCLQHPAVRQKLGLPDKEAEHVAAEPQKDLIVSGPANASRKPGPVSAFDLPSLGLVSLSVTYLSMGKMEKAVRLLRLAVDKDPECFRAWAILGQIMLQKGDYEEASEFSECAISKISLLGEQTNAEAVDFLVQASASAGAAFYRQGKLTEALVHFERIRDMKEPDAPEAKARYYEGLVAFASVLANEGRKDEAAQYLRMAVAFDPEYSVFLKNLNSENNTDDLVSDLASSRRSDY